MKIKKIPVWKRISKKSNLNKLLKYENNIGSKHMNLKKHENQFQTHELGQYHCRVIFGVLANSHLPW